MAVEYTTTTPVIAQEFSRVSDAIAQTFCLYGPSTEGAVTVNSGLQVNVAAISGYQYIINGSIIATAVAGTTQTMAAADATNPRIDVVYVDNAGAVGTVTGTAAASPVPATLGNTRLALAYIKVAANQTVLSSSDIIDKRQFNRIALPEVVGTAAPPGATFANNTGVANTAYFIRMASFLRPLTMTSLKVSQAVAFGNVDFGIYRYDGTTMTKVVSTGSIASAASGNITDTALDPSYRYYFAWAADSATESINRVTFVPSMDGLGFSKAASFPLPATLTSLTGTSSLLPNIVGFVLGGAAS